MSSIYSARAGTLTIIDYLQAFFEIFQKYQA